MPEDSTPALIVRRLGTNEEVDRVPIHTLTESHVACAMVGLELNMEDGYYIDADEVDDAIEALEAEHG